MKEIKVTGEYAGVRSDKLVFKVLKEAGKGFIYKMYRKKNIVLNKKKMTGKELLVEGDVITFFLSDETFGKMSGKKAQDGAAEKAIGLDEERILYADEDLIVYNKESDLLSQSNGRDPHLMERYEVYLSNVQDVNIDAKAEGEVRIKSSYGVCNRLDRNTTGVILIGRNAKALRNINNTIMAGDVQKFYHAVVVGKLEKELELKGYLTKKSSRNKVVISNEPGGDFIHTLVEPLKVSEDGRFTLVKVQIKTGKSHQIRAHLSSVGYPLVGDGKYGDKKTNDYFRKNFGIRFQMLHSYSYTLGDIQGMDKISGKNFVAPYSKEFNTLIQELFS